MGILVGTAGAQADKHAGNGLGHIAEVLCTSHGSGIRDIFLPHDFRDGREQFVGDRVVGVGAGAVEGDQLVIAPPGFYIVVDDLGQPLQDMGPGLLVIGAHAHLEGGGIRKDIDRRAGPEHTGGQGGGGLGVHLPGHEHIGRGIDLVGNHQGVNGELRGGAVPALALDVHDEAVQRGAGDAGAVGHLPHRGGGEDVQREGGVHLGVLQQAVVDHGLGAVAHLLAGLEHELDRPLQFRLMVFQQLGRPQQHGGVGVVAAHVAGLALGAEGQIVDLLHGQGVKVRPQQDAGAPAADGGHHAGGGGHVWEAHGHILFPDFVRHHAAPAGGNAHLGEPLLNVGGRLRQVHAHLRDLVEVAAVGHDLVLNRLCLLVQGFHVCSLLSSLTLGLL